MDAHMGINWPERCEDVKSPQQNVTDREQIAYGIWRAVLYNAALNC